MPIVVLFYPYHIIPQKHDSALSKERGANRSGKILLFTLSAGLNLPERNGILHTTSSIKIMLQGIGVYRIGGETIWCGDFHGQWCEAPASLPLNLAALSICGHDFSLFNSGDTSPAGAWDRQVTQLKLSFPAPRPGSRFQLHFILWDNDGSGLKASLHWPHPETAWYLPSDAARGSAKLLGRRTFAPAGELDHET